MKKTFVCLFLVLTSFAMLVMGSVAYFGTAVSNDYYVRNGENLKLCFNTVVGVSDASTVKTDLKLFGIIPIKTVNVSVAEEEEVSVYGTPFGIKIYSDGVMVVGITKVEIEEGSLSPAESAGIKSGDTITSVDGKEVFTNAEIVEIIGQSGGKSITVKFTRNGKEQTATLTPVRSRDDGKYKVGIWVRDSAAGIGTLTFYSSSGGIVAGLGHGICDVDTDELISVGGGQMTEAGIVGIKKATADTTGELRGMLSGNIIADITANDVTGIYGTPVSLPESSITAKVALKQEVKLGDAEIITTVDGNGARSYSCKIEKIYHNDTSLIKNMIVRITDKELLEKTGGIVQGMSGSPILQNGKLVGAVTHVLVDEPTVGYGIFAENMLKTAKAATNKVKLKDAS